MKEKHKFKEAPDNAMTVWVTRYVKTSKATAFWFSSKDIQIIFQDYTELLISKQQVTYVNKLGERTYFGSDCLDAQPEEIKKRYKYTISILQTIKDSAKNGK